MSHAAAIAGTLLGFLHIFVQIAFIARVLLRPYREPASRIAWVVVIVVVPVLGILGYILLGEINIGRRRVKRMSEIILHLPDPATIGTGENSHPDETAEKFMHLFEAGKSVNGFLPTGGNRAQLLENSNVAIDTIVTDIDTATDHVHLMFYIWLPDTNGCKVAEALQRAALRGITCRVMADSLGSRSMIDSPHWLAMRESGVQLARALPINITPLGLLKGRIDLRNHRKIVVIDNRITYCGSQNCADPEFRIKSKYAPWVDIMVRFEGPVAIQNQYLFASDWMNEVHDDISDIFNQQPPRFEPGLTAQVIGTGPTIRYSAMPEIFESLMYAARKEIVISTPYYVPDESMLAALCACAHRGVETTIIFPAKNDSRFVGAASRSYYGYLLGSGVRIFEYNGGLLHTKSLTFDGRISLIGSANMDRRSFELNYENNILIHDTSLTTDIRNRQQTYIAASSPVTMNRVNGWSPPHKLMNNAAAMLGPIL